MEASFCRSWQLGNILKVDQGAKNKRPWRAQFWVGRLYCVPSLQSAEITVDCRANWRNGRTRGSGDCWEPVLFRHDRVTVTATYSSCNCGYKRTPNAASENSTIVMGCSQSPTPIWRVTLINGWEKSHFSTRMCPLRGHPCFTGWPTALQASAALSGFSVLFILKCMKLRKGREGTGELGRGSSEFGQSTQYSRLELSNNKLKSKKHERRAVASAAVVWGPLRRQERPQGCWRKPGNQGGPAHGSGRRSIWDFQ